MKKTGFTLIELLIAISIIAILATIGFVAYTSVLKSGRDSKRQSDLRSIQSALEQYHNDQGNYPALLSSPLKSPDNTKTYLNQLPQDPLGSAYGYTLISLSYCLYAKLENSNSGLGACPANSDYNFAVTPP